MMAAMAAPAWTNGPSFPMASPPATDPIAPMSLATNVLKWKTPGTSTPFKYALTSLIPDPAAAGPRVRVITTADKTRMAFIVAYKTKEAMYLRKRPCTHTHEEWSSY